MAQMVERPSDLQFAPDSGLPPPSPQAMGGGQGGPGAMEALKKGVSFLLRFMEPEELLQALLQLARTQDLPVDENQLRALVEGANQGTPSEPLGEQMAPIESPGQLQQ